MNITKGVRYLFSVLSGLLLVLSFPYTGSLFPLAFLALVPLLLAEHAVYKQKLRPGKVFIHAYITFIIYNVGTTWWIWNSSVGGAIMAFVANSLLMSIIFFAYHLTKRNIGRNTGFVALFIYWLGFEHLNTFWELDYPWLNLGNIFASEPQIVQWYSITGVAGGSLWILLANFVLFRFTYAYLIQKKPIDQVIKWLFQFVAITIIPIAVSLVMYYNYTEKGIDSEIVVIQPNIDPYTEKFSGEVLPQINEICDLADSLATAKTEFVLAPETALPYLFVEDEVKRVIYYHYLVERKAKWPNAALLIGANTKKYYYNKRSVASMPNPDGPGYEEYYNTAMLIDHLDRPFFLHKSKLVLGVEKIPFVGFFPFLQNFAIENGGTSVTLGAEFGPRIFETNKIKFAPVICYESIFGDFISKQCKKGAEFIAVITNDGWWGDTPGYKQHLAFSQLRAIENRRWVARSANTGTSAFINQRGDVVQKTAWWTRSALRQTIQRNREETIFMRLGDLIGKVCMIIAPFPFVLTLFYRRKRKKSV